MSSANPSSDGSDRSELPLEVQQEEPDELWSGNPAWNELLTNSSANSLFLSDSWQRIWWRHFGAQLSAEPLMLTIRDGSQRLIALAPMLRRQHRYFPLLHSTQISLIGNVWRMNVGEVTEYLDWIVRRGWEQSASATMARYLADDRSWDEIVIAYSAPSSLVRTALLDEASRAGWLLRTERNLPRYAISTTGSFSSYVGTLKGGTRRRIYNKRALLERSGSVQLVNTDSSNLDEQLYKLDTLTRMRWGVGLSDEMLAFYRELSIDLMERDALMFTTLEVDGRPISALYDVRSTSVVYNLRSAIDAAYHPSLSPGLIHLGYVLEIHFASGVERYDLLAGAGKQVDYKQEICDLTDEFTSLQLIRGTLLKNLFHLYDSTWL